MRKPDLSVVICTFNRARYLPISLESLVRQRCSEETFEVLVIDNNSNDETTEVVQRYTTKLGNVRYFFEPRQGLVYARHRGMEEARAPIIAYLDDDAAASSMWVSAIVHCFRSLDPRPACVGGPIELDWGGAPPRWLSQEYWSLYTYLNLGDETIHLNNLGGGVVYGANMAFDRKVLYKIGGFSIATQRQGNALISGDDADICRRLKEKDLPIYYCPEVAVTHFVLPERKTRAFLHRRLIYDGRSQVVIDFLAGRLTREQFVKRAIYDAKILVMHLVEYFLCQISLRPNDARDALYQILRRIGRMQMLLQFIRMGPPVS